MQEGSLPSSPCGLLFSLLWHSSFLFSFSFSVGLSFVSSPPLIVLPCLKNLIASLFSFSLDCRQSFLFDIFILSVHVLASYVAFVVSLVDSLFPQLKYFCVCLVSSLISPLPWRLYRPCFVHFCHLFFSSVILSPRTRLAFVVPQSVSCLCSDTSI